VATKLIGVVIISSPEVIPHAEYAPKRAEVAELKVMACLAQV